GGPLLPGIFSKDEILWQAGSSPVGSPLLWALAVLVAGVTAFYMFRQVFMVFFGECRADHATQHHLHESPSIMTVPLWVLAAGSVLAGWLRVPHAGLFEGWLEPVMGHNAAASAADAETGGAGVGITLMAISGAVAFAGFGLAHLRHYRRRRRADLLVGFVRERCNTTC